MQWQKLQEKQVLQEYNLPIMHKKEPILQMLQNRFFFCAKIKNNNKKQKLERGKIMDEYEEKREQENTVESLRDYAWLLHMFLNFCEGKLTEPQPCEEE